MVVVRDIVKKYNILTLSYELFVIERYKGMKVRDVGGKMVDRY